MRDLPMMTAALGVLGIAGVRAAKAVDESTDATDTITITVDVPEQPLAKAPRTNTGTRQQQRYAKQQAKIAARKKLVPVIKKHVSPKGFVALFVGGFGVELPERQIKDTSLADGGMVTSAMLDLLKEKNP